MCDVPFPQLKPSYQVRLSRPQEVSVRVRKNQEGEKHENVVFNLFTKLIRQVDISPTLLIMRTFEMDANNPVGLKRMALMSELPGLNLKSAITCILRLYAFI